MSFFPIFLNFVYQSQILKEQSIPPILHNAFILLLPVFVWNLLFYKRLPAFYQSAQWDNIPKALDITENVFRFLVFLLPLFFRIELDSATSRVGLVLYVTGVLVYFSSWVIQIGRQDKGFSRTALFRMAPAFTTVIWLSGIALLCKPYFISVVNPRMVYVICVISFVIIHTYHAWCVFQKQSPILSSGNPAKP